MRLFLDHFDIAWKLGYAAILIGIGYILDGLDGRIARLTKTASDFGVQLDSLADIITFGVAPAILALAGVSPPVKESTAQSSSTSTNWVPWAVFLLSCAQRCG